MPNLSENYVTSTNKSLIIFVHGFTGNADETWTYKSEEKDLNSYFPDLVQLVTFGRFDIMTYEYHSVMLEWFDSFKAGAGQIVAKVKGQTRTRQKNVEIEDLGKNLLTELRFNLSKYEEIFFVAHSMGGLVVKSLLLNLSLHSQETLAKIKSLISLAVPHNGSNLANIGNLINDNVQTKSLEPLSDFIFSTNTKWINQAPECSVHCVYGTNDGVVPRNAAIIIGKDIDEISTDTDHSTICKPENDKSVLVSIVKNIVIEESAFVTDESITDAKFSDTLSEQNNLSLEFKSRNVFVGSEFNYEKFNDFVSTDVAKLLFSSKRVSKSVNEVYASIVNFYRSTNKRYLFYSIPGTGKSILAAHFYHVIKEACEKRKTNKETYFVDMASIEKDLINGKITHDEILVLNNNVGEIISKGNANIILDGFETNHELSNRFLAGIEKVSGGNNIILFRRTYRGIYSEDIDKSRNRQTITSILGLKPNATLEVGFPTSDIKKQDFESYLGLICEIINHPKNKISQAIELTIEWFFENRNNIRLLTLILKHLETRDTEKGPAFFLRDYFYEYVRKFSDNGINTDEVFNAASKFCYDMVVRKHSRALKDSSDYLIKRASTQSFEMVGFLASNYILKKIENISCYDKNDPELKTALISIDNVYPYLLNKYSKNILIHEYDEIKFVQIIIHIYHDSGLRLQAFLCYLLGRVKNQRAINSSKKFLLEQQKNFGDIEEYYNEYDNSNVEKIVLHRTIYISLIYLEVPIDKDYIRQIASSPILDKINRGFHLSYYGDNNYIHDADMIADDEELKPFLNTYRQIATKIYGNVNEPMLNLAIYTFFSLSFARLQAGKLSETISNEEIKELACKAKSLHGIHSFNKTYIEVFLSYLDSKLPPITEGLLSIYKLKRHKRNGWNIDDTDLNGVRVERSVIAPESVSEHSDYTVRLAQIYLPSTSKVKMLISNGILEDEYRLYDKSKIIAMLSIHDIGEYEAGDIVKFKRTEKDLVVEKHAVKRLTMITSCFNSSILADPFETIYEPWFAFEENKKDINTIIARELDALECLIQLHLYKLDSANSIKDLKKFSSDLINNINTQIGRELLKQVVEPLFE